MNFQPPQNAETIKKGLLKIISENPDYWLKDDRRIGWYLYLEYIDKYHRNLGWLKEYLKQDYIPTQDNVIRRLREIKEDIKKGKIEIKKQPTIEELAQKGVFG